MASEHPNRTVVDYMRSATIEERRVIVDDLAGRIDLGVYTIANLIQELQPYMAEEASMIDTAKALGLVSAIVARIQVPLQRVDTHELVLYFARRLQNSDQIQMRAGIPESATALQELIKHDSGRKFVPDDTETVVRAIFAVEKNGVLRDLKAPGRLSLIELLTLLTEKHKLKIIKHVGQSDFVEGVVSMAEFEKDPSNLRCIFKLYAGLSATWTLTNELLTKIWESYSRYFPITLVRIDSNPLVATPEELRGLLLACFISHDFYAKEAFPRLIDMLDTNQDISANVKKDVFNTMAACIAGYSVEVVLEWSQKIWDSLKFEIWNGENSEFIDGSLKVIASLARKVGGQDVDWNDEGSVCAKFISSMYQECVQRIVDSKQRYMLSTSRILYALASASPYMFQWAPRKVFPALLTLSGDLDAKPEKTLLLEVFNGLLRARTDVEDQLNEVLRSNLLQSDEYLRECKATKLPASLSPFRERVVELYWNATTEAGLSRSPDGILYRISIMKGLTLLTAIPEFLADMERGVIIQSLNSTVTDQDEPNAIYIEALTALQQISIADVSRFKSITLAHFEGYMPLHMPTYEEYNPHNLTYNINWLASLVDIACGATQSSPMATNRFELFNELIRFLLSRLSSILDPEQLGEKIKDANILLTAILHAIHKFDSVIDAEIALGLPAAPFDASVHPYRWLLEEILNSVVQVKEVSTGNAYVGLSANLEENFDTYKLVSTISSIITSVLRSNRTTKENNFLGTSENTCQVWSFFIHDVPDSINASQMDLKGGPADKCLVLNFSLAIVAGTRRTDKALLGLQVGDVAMAMINNAMTSDLKRSPFNLVSSLYLLQLLVNKFGAGKEVLSEGGITLGTYMETFASDAATESFISKLQRRYQLMAYYAVAALGACDPSDRVIIQQMARGLEHNVLGLMIARSFKMLLGGSDVLEKSNFALLRPLRQGRLYAYTVDTLMDGWRQAPSPDVKQNYLVAFIGVLFNMEPSVYLDNAEDVFPLLLESTNVQNDEFTKLACVTIIRKLIPACPELIVSHLDSIISRMTDRTRNTYYSPSDANVQCRAAAIDVLTLLTQYVDKAQLIKRKVRVMGELDIALDDPSNLVRERAQKCKLAWFKQVGLVDIA